VSNRSDLICDDICCLRSYHFLDFSRGDCYRLSCRFFDFIFSLLRSRRRNLSVKFYLLNCFVLSRNNFALLRSQRRIEGGSIDNQKSEVTALIAIHTSRPEIPRPATDTKDRQPELC